MIDVPTSWSEVQHRMNTGIFSYRDPNIGLANSGHTLQSQHDAAKGILAATAIIGGGMAVRGAYSATAPVRNVMTWVRHPVAKYLATYRTGTALGSSAKVYLQASKGIRYANYVAFAMNPLATYHYLRTSQYDKAMIQYFGPIGSVWVYNKITESRGPGVPSSKGEVSTSITSARKPGVFVKPRPKGKKVTKKMPEEQRKRLWRMGLRWCKQHKRYDRCSLRARR